MFPSHDPIGAVLVGQGGRRIPTTSQGVAFQPGIEPGLSKAEREKQEKLTAPQLFSEFNRRVKPFIDQRDAFNRVRASVQDPSAAGDLALIFNFMKVLDPGSTVREGEFANAQNSAGIPDRVRSQYNRVVNGRRLSKSQRQDFLRRS